MVERGAQVEKRRAAIRRRPPDPATSPAGLWSVAATAAELPLTWKSRPADQLIGPIARERAGDASARMDTIFADRLDGFRERQLARKRGGKR